MQTDPNLPDQILASHPTEIERRLEQSEAPQAVQITEPQSAVKETIKEKDESEILAEVMRKHELISEQFKSMTDKATGVVFPSTLGPGYYLTGVGVRKRAIVNVYAVGMYTAPDVKDALIVMSGRERERALQVLRSAAKAVPTTFLLDYVLKTTADVIATTLGDAVENRMEAYPDASEGEILAATEMFKQILFESVENSGGVATKGTTIRFDCDLNDGVRISLDGQEVGTVPSRLLSKALCDIYLDDKTFSQQLRDCCLQTWCAP
mmetsp:Transcript_1835/g.3223  ORF Transcript_1835/g.3223 Transcript_1835/m.3223 type:complete len:265 (-) Transcript_1835:216-1010(-)